MAEQTGGTVEALIELARKEPIGVDVSDYSDEWVAGFLAGQASVLEELDRDPETNPFYRQGYGDGRDDEANNEPMRVKSQLGRADG